MLMSVLSSLKENLQTHTMLGNTVTLQLLFGILCFDADVSVEQPEEKLQTHTMLGNTVTLQLLTVWNSLFSLKI